MSLGHQHHQRLRLQTDAIGISAIVSRFVFVLLLQYDTLGSFLLSRESFYSHGFIWELVGLYRGLYKKAIIAIHHFHCHSSLASNNTNITFSSRFVAFVHSTSVFIFIVTSCSSRFLASRTHMRLPWSCQTVLSMRLLLQQNVANARIVPSVLSEASASIARFASSVATRN